MKDLITGAIDFKLKCEKVNASFIDKAPWKFINSIEIKAPALKVFDILADAATWPRWFPGMREARWLGTPGKGSDREVTVEVMRTLEHFIEWQPGKQMSFYISETSLPFVTRMCEDYQLEDSTGGCMFTYRVGLETREPLSWFEFAGKPLLEKMFRDATRGLKRFVENDKS